MFRNEEGRLVDFSRSQKAEIHLVCDNCVYGEFLKNAEINGSIRAQEILRKAKSELETD